MKKSMIILFILIIFLLSFYSKEATSNINKVDEKVLEKIQEQGSVRVMIKFKDNTVSKLAEKTINSLEDKIKHKFSDRISAIISEDDLFEHLDEVKMEYETIDGHVVEVQIL